MDKIKKNDFILISIILIICLLSFIFYFSFTKNSGKYVRVQVNNSTIKTLPLNKNTSFVIKSENGGTNTLVIKNGSAYISKASCKNQICVHHKKISKTGETIVCLPNKIIITITN